MAPNVDFDMRQKLPIFPTVLFYQRAFEAQKKAPGLISHYIALSPFFMAGRGQTYIQGYFHHRICKSTRDAVVLHFAKLHSIHWQRGLLSRYVGRLAKMHFPLYKKDTCEKPEAASSTFTR